MLTARHRTLARRGQDQAARDAHARARLLRAGAQGSLRGQEHGAHEVIPLLLTRTGQDDRGSGAGVKAVISSLAVGHCTVQRNTSARRYSTLELRHRVRHLRSQTVKDIGDAQICHPPRTRPGSPVQHLDPTARALVTAPSALGCWARRHRCARTPSDTRRSSRTGSPRPRPRPIVEAAVSAANAPTRRADRVRDRAAVGRSGVARARARLSLEVSSRGRAGRLSSRACRRSCGCWRRVMVR